MMRQNVFFRRTAVIIFLVSFAATTYTGCSSTVTVTANQASLADDTIKKTEVALWWGISDPLENVDCKGNCLKYVSVKTNWLYSLCTVVTLGAVVPMDVEYRCMSASMQDGGTLGLLQEKKK